MAKLIYIDVETGGTDPTKHALLEIGGVIEVNNKICEKFNWHLKPFPGDVIDDEALEVTGFKREEIETWSDPKNIHTLFIEMLDKYVDRYNKKDKFSLIAYNAIFDDQCLREWFKKCKDKYYGSFIAYPPIDVAVLAGAEYIEERPNFSDFRLMTVAEHMGIRIDQDKAHSAFYDIAITYKIFKALMQRRK
jgi:DNA polymerase-3 subunit epsilon